MLDLRLRRYAIEYEGWVGEPMVWTRLPLSGVVFTAYGSRRRRSWTGRHETSLGDRARSESVTPRAATACREQAG